MAERHVEGARLKLSVVVPLFNEHATVVELYSRLTAVLMSLAYSYEILFIDDGSSDSTFLDLSRLGRGDPHMRVVKLARNYGQTAALAAGFDEAAGDIIVTMDGDLQHAPEDLPALVAKLREGYDIVSGWRQHR